MIKSSGAELLIWNMEDVDWMDIVQLTKNKGLSPRFPALRSMSERFIMGLERMELLQPFLYKLLFCFEYNA